MSNRSCTQSDLRICADMRVGADGTPLLGDMQNLAILSKGLIPDDGIGWFWWCAGCDSINTFYRYRDALAHVHGEPVFESTPEALRSWDSLEHAGEPHKGRVGVIEQAVVAEHLNEVNANLASKGIRQMDPTNPLHARRYGLDQPLKYLKAMLPTARGR